MRDYIKHIISGALIALAVSLPVMCLIVVVAMLIIIMAMAMDAVFGWRKAKLRSEARTSYLFSRSITKFAFYTVIPS